MPRPSSEIFRAIKLWRSPSQLSNDSSTTAAKARDVPSSYGNYYIETKSGGPEVRRAEHLECFRLATGQATFEVTSATGSGAGAQIYAEKMGRCSARSPRDMIIPRGSSDSVTSRTFFITVSLVACPIQYRAPSPIAPQVPHYSANLTYCGSMT